MELMKNDSQTMTSIDLRDVVNEARAVAGQTAVENGKFIKRVEDELEGEIGVSKTFRHPQSGVKMRYYDLTMDQCMLVGMRESKAVRRRVLERLKALETKSTSPAMQYHEKATASAELYGAAKIVAKHANLDENYQLLKANQMAYNKYGIDWNHELELKLESPQQEKLYTPTELGEKIGGLSAQKVNKMLAGEGLQQKEKKGWSPTDKGKFYSRLLDVNKPHKDGTPVQQLKWYESVVQFLQD